MKIAVIGSGNMGSAFIRHLSKDHSVTVCDKGSGKGEALAKEVGAKYEKDLNLAVKEAEIVILAVKPKDLKHLNFSLTSEQILISLLVGTSIAAVKKVFSKARVIRLMPNMAISVEKGLLGFSAEEVTSSEKNLMDTLFSSMGLVIWVLESKLEGFAALGGSSPAFIFVLIESMIDAGLHVGFSAKESKEVVLKVLEGCAALLQETSLSPQELKWQVTSPGGTTIAGLKALEESGFREGIWSAIEATYQESLSKET